MEIWLLLVIWYTTLSNLEFSGRLIILRFTCGRGILKKIGVPINIAATSTNQCGIRLGAKVLPTVRHKLDRLDYFVK